MATDFKKYDSRGTGELQEDEAMRLLEARGETKRFVELRQMVQEMDYDQNRELSMLEWACAYYGKSWKVLHTPSVNQEEIDAAIAKIREATRKEVEAGELARAKEREKHEAAEAEERRVQELERRKREAEQKRQQETTMGGIKGAAAKFHYAGADTQDQTKTNADKIKAEAAARLEQKRLEKEKLQAEEDRVRAIAEIKRAEEEKKKAEEGSAEALRRKQEEMKLQAEENERLAAQAEIERKAKVQAKLKEKFGGQK